MNLKSMANSSIVKAGKPASNLMRLNALIDVSSNSDCSVFAISSSPERAEASPNSG